MVTIIAPLAIFLGAAAAAALAFFTFWESFHSGAVNTSKRFELVLDRAGVRRKPEDLVITWIVISAVLWIGTVLALQPTVVIGILILPIAAAVAGFAYAGFVQIRLKTRVESFLNQFENVLRLMASGLRSGLGFQQSLSMVVDESKEPSRHEFARVIGQANIGIGIHDALDDLAERIKTNETLMMARVVRINSQTGGDLARVLEQLANTIKERRRMRNKIKSLTAEGRAGAAILGALPIFLGAFILLTQPQMAHGLLYTPAGHIVFIIVAIQEALGIYFLSRILKVNV